MSGKVKRPKVLTAIMKVSRALDDVKDALDALMREIEATEEKEKP